ncbi:sigma-54 dependent transcriptional regulator [Methylosinus sp. KRF6]|uniref:sigma-54-dependent transcriptional regulator n=1 Tax=Methylosinus sp. KRF6 TaxID=2846853 RepID=UPI001C0C69BF|nr:sigma-54 dependent transcriptional regulator [Methylosinus sp. KRF6]MBU3890914.1 sigma-54 dependent transcriptional regulator [Methylosinus sp. KRF6]
MIVEDDAEMRWLLRNIFGDARIATIEACDGREAFELVQRRRPDIVLLDLRLPGDDGVEVLQRLRCYDMALPVIVMTAYGTIASAMDALRSGAFDYLTKPFCNDHLLDTVLRAISQTKRRAPLGGSDFRRGIMETMGESAAIQKLVDQLEIVVGTDYSVLLLGETGTGKEVLARTLHASGRRKEAPLVIVDCGALVESLTDVELFGAEKGAYTGAHERRRGRFEIAGKGGTLFLDEIGNFSLIGQQALLRVLEERAIYRVGGNVPIPVDARIIAATNENLYAQVEDRRFRSDLYFRLAEYVIELPPLRSRMEDIALLARRFLMQASKELERDPIDIAPDAIALLERHDWPGNVRELRNVVRRATLTATSFLGAEHVEASLRSSRSYRPTAIVSARRTTGKSLRRIVADQVRETERLALLDALDQAGGNKAQAARLLGMDYKTYRTKLKQLGSAGPAPDSRTEPGHASH